MTPRRLLYAIAAAALSGFWAAPQAGAAAGPAATADAFSVLVDVTTLPLDIELHEGPMTRATQDTPRAGPAAGPMNDEILGFGPYPSDGSLVEHVGPMGASASAEPTPEARVIAWAEGVALLAGDSTPPRITADSVTAQSASDCAGVPTADVTFENLRVKGEAVTDPAPNTVVSVDGFRVILNEQRPASSGRGLVVNAIHVVDPLTEGWYTGDLIVGHAMSSVACANGADTSNAAPQLTVTAQSSRSAARRGTEVTYAIDIANASIRTGCRVRSVTARAPAGFDLVSTTGDLGSAPETQTWPGLGVEAIFRPGSTLPVGGHLRQDLVLRPGDEAIAGATAYLDVDVRCSNVGNYASGLLAPVAVDVQSPDTRLDAAPPAVVSTATPEARFGSDDPEATFECRLDDGAFAPCASPYRLPATADGPHVLQIRAVDSAGNVDSSPAEARFIVDTTPPDTLLAAAPPAFVSSPTPEVRFGSAEAGISFQCQLDAGPYVPCASPHRLAATADGPHVLRVRAVDAVGNADATPVVAAFVIDTVRPKKPRFRKGPKGRVRSRTARFRFVGEAVGAFQCKLDGGKWKACKSQRRYRSLRPGRHRFSVRQVDPAGNVGSARTRRWTVRR